MKKLLLLIAVLFFTGSLWAQVAAISGATTLCAGTTGYTFTDATAGGTWSSSNTTVATIIDTTGILTALTPGTANIVYRVGPSTVSLAVTVYAPPNPISGPTSLCVGTTISLTDSGGGTWMSYGTSIATVGTLTGVVSGIAYGTVEIEYIQPISGCGAFTFIRVDTLPDRITGNTAISNIPGGNTTTLRDATLHGTWSSSNIDFASVGATTGLVTGYMSGLVNISYTLPTGCTVDATVSINQIPDTNVEGNLVAWYPFCADSKDHTTGGHDLINSGVVGGTVVPSVTATFTTDRFGNDSSAFLFGNSEMYYSSVLSASTLTGSITYSCWIYPTAAQNSVILYDGDLSTPALSNGFGFVMNDGTDWLAPAPYTPVAGQYVSVLLGGVGQYLPYYVNLNQWYNLVLTKVGNAWTFYVNDAIWGIFTGNYNTFLATGIFALGNDATLSKPFNGKIDDVASWSRKLDAVEIEEVYNFNPDVVKFSLGTDTVICTDAITLAPEPQTLGALYTWGTVDPATFIPRVIETTVTDTSLQVYPAASIFYPSTYWLTITKSFGCFASDTINVFKLPIPVHLGSDTNICKGDTVTLRAHSDSSASTKFTWSTGNVSDSIKVFTSGTYWVTVDSEFYYFTTTGYRDSATCVGRDTVSINVRNVPHVDLGPDVGSCLGLPDTIWNIDSLYDSSSYVYTWSVFTGGDSLIVNTSGTFWLEVNNGGCARYDTVNVVIVFDTVYLHEPRDTAICKGSTITMDRVSLNPLPLLTYQWTPTTGIRLSTVPRVAILPDTSSWYVLKASYPGCPDILDSFFIDVQPNPIVYLGGNRPVCEYDTVHVNASVSPAWYPDYTYTWTPTTYIDTQHGPNVVFTAGDTTNLVLTVSTPYGCTGKDSVELIVHPGSFDSALTDIFLCPGDSAQLMPMLNASGILNGVIASTNGAPALTSATLPQICPGYTPLPMWYILRQAPASMAATIPWPSMLTCTLPPPYILAIPLP